jgi:CDP-diacylglycerol--glycerol-3-phosphate 3-phosphatidyltransferase
MTPANAVTVARVALAPILLLLVAGTGPSWPALVLWIGLAATDGVDGYIARRHGTTRSGAFLDPLADKILVLGAMAVLAAEGLFDWLPVLVIAGREVAISAWRSRLARQGVSVPARWSAKVKTVLQDVAVGMALCPPLADHRPGLSELVLWVAVALTLVSGAQYVLDGRKGPAVAV